MNYFKKIIFIIFLFYSSFCFSVEYKCENINGVAIDKYKINQIKDFGFTFSKKDNVLLFDENFIPPNRTIFLTKLNSENSEIFSGSVESEEMWNYDNGTYIYSVGINDQFVYSLMGTCRKIN